jgi:hypothetical protein
VSAARLANLPGKDFQGGAIDRGVAAVRDSQTPGKAVTLVIERVQRGSNIPGRRSSRDGRDAIARFVVVCTCACACLRGLEAPFSTVTRPPSSIDRVWDAVAHALHRADDRSQGGLERLMSPRMVLARSAPRRWTICVVAIALGCVCCSSRWVPAAPDPQSLRCLALTLY